MGVNDLGRDGSVGVEAGPVLAVEYFFGMHVVVSVAGKIISLTIVNFNQ